VPAEKDRDMLLDVFKKDNKKVVAISSQQMSDFAGNMFQVFSRDNTPYLVMSRRAYNALTLSQRRILESFNKLITPELDTIETHGGGSARCMLAEVV
ncbi:MAG: arginine deiminase-related protein, partial [Bacteroidales bacterium]|nr:arginine deiminase-related protein [Bacteroidales bacterium]